MLEPHVKEHLEEYKHAAQDVEFQLQFCEVTATSNILLKKEHGYIFLAMLRSLISRLEEKENGGTNV